MNFKKAEEALRDRNKKSTEKYKEIESIRYYLIRGICPKCGKGVVLKTSLSLFLSFFNKGPDVTRNYKCNDCGFTHVHEVYFQDY